MAPPPSPTSNALSIWGRWYQEQNPASEKWIEPHLEGLIKALINSYRKERFNQATHQAVAFAEGEAAYPQRGMSYLKIIYGYIEHDLASLSQAFHKLTPALSPDQKTERFSRLMDLEGHKYEFWKPYRSPPKTLDILNSIHQGKTQLEDSVIHINESSLRNYRTALYLSPIPREQTSGLSIPIFPLKLRIGVKTIASLLEEERKSQALWLGRGGNEASLAAINEKSRQFRNERSFMSMLQDKLSDQSRKLREVGNEADAAAAKAQKKYYNHYLKNRIKIQPSIKFLSGSFDMLASAKDGSYLSLIKDGKIDEAIIYYKTHVINDIIKRAHLPQLSPELELKIAALIPIRDAARGHLACSKKYFINPYLERNFR